MKILYFDKQGFQIYKAKDETGHIWYDICNCEACEEHAYEDQLDTVELCSYRRKNKLHEGKPLMSQEKLQERYENGDRTVDLLGEPSGKFDFLVSYDDAPLPTSPLETSMCKLPPPPKSYTPNLLLNFHPVYLHMQSKPYKL